MCSAGTRPACPAMARPGISAPGHQPWPEAKALAFGWTFLKWPLNAEFSNLRFPRLGTPLKWKYEKKVKLKVHVLDSPRISAACWRQASLCPAKPWQCRPRAAHSAKAACGEAVSLQDAHCTGEVAAARPKPLGCDSFPSPWPPAIQKRSVLG